MKSLKIVGAMVASVFALAIFFSPVQADFSVVGDLEIDTTYSAKSTDPDADETEYDLNGRIKVQPTARKEAGNMYMEAIAQILAKVDGSAGIDDAWGKIGTSKFDIQIGRYEGWNLYDESNDMLIVDAPTGAARYKANYARGRMDGAGQLALHVLPNDAFGLEVGLVYGQDSDDLGAGDVDVNQVGIRPVILTKFGPVEFSAGADMLTITPQDDNAEGEISKVGFGARVKAAFSIVTLGIDYANGTEGGTDATTGNDLDDQTTSSIGGYCDLALGKGVLTMGGSFTTLEKDSDDYTQEHNQYYVAYAHPLPIDGAAIKFAVSQASASNDDPAIEDSDALGFKVRLYYAF